MTRREVYFFQTSDEAPLSALEYNLNMELAAPGREFAGVECHVVGASLVVVVMFTTTEEE